MFPSGNALSQFGMQNVNRYLVSPRAHAYNANQLFCHWFSTLYITDRSYRGLLVISDIWTQCGWLLNTEFMYLVPCIKNILLLKDSPLIKDKANRVFSSQVQNVKPLVTLVSKKTFSPKKFQQKYSVHVKNVVISV